MKDKYIKKITIFSCIETVSLLILMLSAFHYIVGTQGGDYLFNNKPLNILAIVLLIVLLTVLWILKLILKRKRRKFLIDHDRP